MTNPLHDPLAESADSPAAFVIAGARTADGEARDWYVADGHLVDEEPSGATRIDADGLLILPGLVDLHTHLREPGREDAETIKTGTLAAARGGYTCVFAMANTDPVTDTPERAETILEMGRRDGSAQVVPVGAVTRNLDGKELADMALMARSRAHVRVFSDDGRCVTDSLLMRRALEWVRPFGGVVAEHAQDTSLAGPDACAHECEISGRLGLGEWPAAAESVIVARDVELARLTGSHVQICHVSTAESVDIIRWAKQRGINVTAEVTPHHLYFTTREIESYDTTFKVNPPLRTDEHVEAVRAALADGTIDTVGTDHAPHAPQDKDHPFPTARPGMLGLEQALGVVMEVMVSTGRMDWPTLVRRMSTTPASIGQARGQGVPVAVGSPANLVLVDPTAKAVVDRRRSASLSRNNPYDGRLLPDPVVATLWAGRVTYQR